MINDKPAEIDISVLISKVLDSIPSHREDPKSIEEIAASSNEDNRIATEFLTGFVASTATILEIFGVLRWQGRLCQTTGQIPTYFRNSLSWYFRNHQRLFSNWEVAGTASQVNGEDLLDKAPYFLKFVENRRLTLSQQFGLEPGCSRLETVAVDIVTATDRGVHYFLHQWDPRAEQYQLIGGRQKSNENHLETAKREIQEELSRNRLVYGQDYELTLLSNKPIDVSGVSRTYGALTRYEFWLYAVTFKLKQLRLREGDRWVSLDEMRNGTTKTGKRVGDADFFKLIDSTIPGGLEKLPPSIEIRQTEDCSSFV